MKTRVLKWNVPVDDRPHNIGTGFVVHVGTQGSSTSVQVWTLEGPEELPTRPVQVFGTGQPLPTGWRHIGSTVAAGGVFVWHVFEAPPEQWGARTPDESEAS